MFASIVDTYRWADIHHESAPFLNYLANLKNRRGEPAVWLRPVIYKHLLTVLSLCICDLGYVYLFLRCSRTWVCRCCLEPLRATMCVCLLTAKRDLARHTPWWVLRWEGISAWHCIHFSGLTSHNGSNETHCYTGYKTMLHCKWANENIL